MYGAPTSGSSIFRSLVGLATTPQQRAKQRLENTVYDLVVCDLAMPDVDGAAVASAVEHLAPPRPALLLMTGYADGPTYAEFLQTTPAVVLNKPVGIDALREWVRRLRESRSSRTMPQHRHPPDGHWQSSLHPAALTS